MADTRLPLEVNARPLDTATPITNMGNQQYQNTMNEEAILKAHYDALDTRERSRLSSTIAGAAQLKPYLDSGDLEGAHQFLLRRREQLQGRIGSGENIDTQETDAAIEMLRKGDIESLKNGVQGLMAAGQVYGILSNKDMPSNIQEWQYYNSLPPDKQQEYLTMKRANPAINLGGTQMIPNPVNPAGAPLANYPVTPKPEDMPDFKRAQAQAAAEGTGAGEASANANTTITKSGGLLAALENLKQSAGNAPSGAIMGGIASGANVTGIGGDAAVAQGDFTVKRAAAENAIREAFRVVGSGGQSDADALPFIQMLPSAADATDVKVAKTDAAMQAVRTKVSSLAQQRGLPDPFNGGQNFTTYGQSSSAKITVSNGQETFEIDPADLPAAQAEGFKKI